MGTVLMVISKGISFRSDTTICMMKNKSGEFPVKLVLHKRDEGHIRKFLIEISPSSGLREKNQHLSLTKPKIKAIRMYCTPKVRVKI